MVSVAQIGVQGIILKGEHMVREIARRIQQIVPIDAPESEATGPVAAGMSPASIERAAAPVLPDDPDYARMWNIVNTNNANRYIEYQKKTSRPIPVVVLTPKA